MRPAYGCYKVTAPGLDVRQSGSRNGNVVATVSKGAILVKRKRFCSLGGVWCPVTTKDGVQGFADKASIAIAACPARLSTKVN